MRELFVAPGYHEINIYVDGKLLYRDKNPEEMLFGDDSYSNKEYVNILTKSFKYMDEDDGLNIELFKTLSDDELEEIGLKYENLLNNMYGK